VFPSCFFYRRSVGGHMRDAMIFQGLPTGCDANTWIRGRRGTRSVGRGCPLKNGRGNSPGRQFGLSKCRVQKGIAAGEKTSVAGSGFSRRVGDRLLRPRGTVRPREAGSTGEPQLVRLPDAAAGA
jgi:hypothetical protein